MLSPILGGIDVAIDPIGSRFVQQGIVRGWIPMPTRLGAETKVILLIDGKEVGSKIVTTADVEADTASGSVARLLFAMAVPRDFYGKAVHFSVQTPGGQFVTDGDVHVSIDDHGNAHLVDRNPHQIRLTEKAVGFAKEKRVSKAFVLFNRLYCREIIADVALAVIFAKCFAELDQLESANIVLDAALERQPQDHRSLALLGKGLLALNRFQEALEFLNKAIALDGEAIDAHYAKVKAVIGLNSWEIALTEAHKLRQRALPDTLLAELSGTISWLYLNLSKPEIALTEATVALNRFPGNIRLMQLRGDALVRLSRYDEAVTIYRAALARDTKRALLRKRAASALMLTGAFGEAADQDEGRRLTPTFAKLNNAPATVPAWTGQPSIPGKLLVWSEVNFGVGQNILHAGLIPDLVALGHRIVLEVEARLVPVFARAFPEISIIEQVAVGESRGAWFAEISHQVPIGSLARYFRRNLVDFAGSRPYLTFDQQNAAQLRQSLLGARADRDFLVGFSWTSTNPYVGDEKSVPLPALLRALDLPGVSLVTLQYGDHAEEIAVASAETGVAVLMSNDVDCTNDLVALSNLMGAVDMVICIGHTTAHLAGALGVPSLVMVPSSPFPHWLGEGSACVWYPTSKIVRQRTDDHGKWDSVLAEIEQRLAMATLARMAPAAAVSAHPLKPIDTERQFANFYRNALTLAIQNTDYELIITLAALIEGRFASTPDLMELAADGYFRIGDPDNALRCYDVALALGGDYAAITRKTLSTLIECYDIDAAARRFEVISADQPAVLNEAPDLRIRHSQILFNLAQFDTAVAILFELLAEAPGNTEAALTCAQALAASGDHDRAKAILESALSAAYDPELQLYCAVEIGRRGHVDMALHLLEDCLAIRKDTVGTFWLGQFRARVGHKTRFVIPQIQGDLPKPGRDQIVVFVCMDSAYCGLFLKSIVGSMMQNSPESALHVHLVQPNNAAIALIDSAKLVMGERFTYSFEKVKFRTDDEEFKKTYFASIRFVRLAEIMALRPAIYYVMDADNIVRGDLNQFSDILHGNDILIRHRFSLKPYHRVAACGILLGAGDGGLGYMQRVSTYILNCFRSGHAAWYLDQIALTTALQDIANDPDGGTVAQLPVTLLDWDFSAESVVWTGKGKRRSSNMRYTAEYRNYTISFDHQLEDMTATVRVDDDAEEDMLVQ